MGALFEKYKSELLTDVDPDPCGPNPIYTDLWETIQEEIAKAPPLSGDPDWSKVENDCANFLSGTSKDLRIMNALAEALARNHGLNGLADGFHLCRIFYEKYWESMYPPKKKKNKAMTSFSNKLETLTPQMASATHQPLKRALKGLEELKACLAKVNPGAVNPSFSKLQEHLNASLIQLGPEQKEVKEEPKKEVQAPKQTPASPALAAASAPTTRPPAPAPVAAPTPSPAPAAPAAPAADAPIKDQLSVLSTISASIRTQSPHLSISYRLLRMSCWAQAKLPKRSSGFETFILAPGDLVRESLKNMADQGSWSPLLTRCETLTNRFPFWLDVQYYALKAAQALGPEYEEVHRVIEEESRLLAKRFPELQELKFNDGSPFALPFVKEWLDRLAREVKASSKGPEDPAAALKSELARQGDEFAKALKLAQARIEDVENPLDRFRMKLTVASFALSVNQATWALHILKGLIAMAKAHHLKVWEPKLVARLWVETVKATNAPELEKQNAALLLQAKTELAELDLASIAVLSG